MASFSAAQRDRVWDAEPATEQQGGITIRVGKMSVNDVELPLGLQTSQQGQGAQVPSSGHPIA